LIWVCWIGIVMTAEAKAENDRQRRQQRQQRAQQMRRA
jgi:hypothetical protein